MAEHSEDANKRSASPESDEGEPIGPQLTAVQKAVAEQFFAMFPGYTIIPNERVKFQENHNKCLLRLTKEVLNMASESYMSALDQVGADIETRITTEAYNKVVELHGRPHWTTDDVTKMAQDLKVMMDGSIREAVEMIFAQQKATLDEVTNDCTLEATMDESMLEAVKKIIAQVEENR